MAQGDPLRPTTVQTPPGSRPVSPPATGAPGAWTGAGTGGLATGGASAVSEQDLTTDILLLAAPRMAHSGKQVPALGGIPLLAKLGQGGMGAVYFGVHPRLQRDVAVKVLPFHLADKQPQLVQRFFREAQIAARVQSPHLVNVSDVNQEGGLFYLVMEYVSGVSAGAFLHRLRETGQTGLPVSVALDICVAATEGLAAAHSKGVVHRDVKPDNILIPLTDAAAGGAPGSGALCFTDAKLADLGLARSDELGSSLTGSHDCMGTPGYMSPEQALDAKHVGKAADVFSMGATLYALLSGQAPFTGSALMKVLVATTDQPHTPIARLRPDVPAATAELLDRCLAKDPAHRFADGAALLQALRVCRAAAGESEAFQSQAIAQLTTLQRAPETGLPVQSSQDIAAFAPPSTAASAASTALPATIPSGPAVTPAAARSARARTRAVALAAAAALGLSGAYGLWAWRESGIRNEIAQAESAARTKGKDPAQLAEAIAELQALEARFAGRPSQEMDPIRALLADLNDRKAIGEAVAAAREKGKDIAKTEDAISELQRAEGKYAARPEGDLKELRALLAELKDRKALHELRTATAAVRERAKDSARLGEAIGEAQRLESSFAARPEGDLKELRALLTDLKELKTAADAVAAARDKAKDAAKVEEAIADLQRTETRLAHRPESDLGALRGLLGELRDRKTADDTRKAKESEAKQGLSTALTFAQQAMTADDPERAVAALEKPVKAVREMKLEHPNLELAETTLAKARAAADERTRAKAKAQEGTALLAEKKYAEAKAAFDAAKALWPQSPDGPKITDGLAQAARGMSDLRYQAAVERGKQAVAQKQWRDAEAAYKDALVEKANDAEAMKGLDVVKQGGLEERYAKAIADGKAALAAKQWSQAQAAFKRATDEKPGDAAATEGATAAQNGARDDAYAEAVAAGKKAAGEKQWEAAMAAFRKAVALKSDGKEAADGIAEATRGQVRSGGVELKMDAKSNWFETSIPVRKGDTLTISATGKWKAGSGSASGPLGGFLKFDFTDPSGEGGLGHFRILNKDKAEHKFFAETLIGRIGDATAFYVGKGTTVQAETDGPLKFRMNEEGLPGGTSDNEGELTLKISLSGAE